jgi:uncharacterized protein (TIGR03118 family)
MLNGSPRLYAANFHAGTIDVFDGSFQLLDTKGTFRDPHLPKGYAPFNVAELRGKLYVAYAVQDADAADEVAGPGKGIVDVFDNAGHFLRRLISHGQLNAPWGMTIAPQGFGDASGDLLVGNFGDGRIYSFDLHDGHPEGALRDANHRKIEIDGLWALMFGNGTTAKTTTLLFTAGPDEESHGLFGAITMATAKDP